MSFNQKCTDIVIRGILLLIVSVISLSRSALAEDKSDRWENIGSWHSNNIIPVWQLRNTAQQWEIETLAELNNNYKCLDRSYLLQSNQSGRSITRYEFAVLLETCLQHLEQSLNIYEPDLTRIEQLNRNFARELSELRTRQTTIKNRVSRLEENQFSPTAKLLGEAIFALGGVVISDEVDGEDLDETVVFGNQAELELNISFSGQDLLLVRLDTGNFSEFSDVTNTPEGNTSLGQPDDNNLGISVIYYQLLITNNTDVFILATGGGSDDFANTFNFFDGDGSSGSISVFGTRNPIFYPASGTGAGVKTTLENWQFSLGYLAGDANSPNAGEGLFNGAYSLVSQIAFTPGDRFSLGLTYIHSYNQLDTGTGSNLANFRSFTESIFASAVPTSSNSYGAQLSWELSDRLVVGGWASYTNARTLDNLNGNLNRGSLDIWNWALTLAVKDVGKEGSVVGLIVGMEPRLVDSSINLGNRAGEDEDTSLHLEAFYEYKLNENIAITPGLIWITAPNHNRDNNDLVIGIVRTTFVF